jgi:hypothetical protein
MNFLEFMLYFGFPLGTTAVIMIAVRFYILSSRRQWARMEQRARERDATLRTPSPTA